MVAISLFVFLLKWGPPRILYQGPIGYEPTSLPLSYGPHATGIHISYRFFSIRDFGTIKRRDLFNRLKNEFIISLS